jgi:thiol:disulfide interchange protein DsbD
MDLRKCLAAFGCFLLTGSAVLLAQMKIPVSWSYSTKKLSDCEFELVFTAKMDPTWHLYSQVPTEDGPLPTVFNFTKSPSYQLVGKTSEPKPISKPEPAFDNAVINYFEGQAVFKQKIKVLRDGDLSIKGTIDGMTCNEGQCIPFSPAFDFEFRIPGAKACSSDMGGVKPAPVTGHDTSPAPFKLPYRWSYTTEKISDCEYMLTLTADLDEHWHLYAQSPGGDALPTVFTFNPSSSYQLVGKTSEPEPIAKREPAFDDSIVRYFEKQAVFKQKIRVLAGGTVSIKGSIEGQVCQESQCIQFAPPVDFEFSISGAKPCTAEITASDAPDNSWLGIFFAGFFGGFAALLTPCVFPMIPMTVSFFTKRSKTKAKGISNALIYASSIIVIYVGLGLGVSAIFGADALNALSTNVWFNLFFFLLLFVFAISFFGAFEITLPSSFVNKVDSASDRGGLIGIFFMAFTLSLVSFSCTGPIIGTLLVQAASEGGAGPFWGMFGFSLALALPFGLFAAFPGWLNSLPKSGGWLNSVKVFLGFLELGFAFKFLSNADLVVQTGLLTREIFLSIWIMLSALLGAYLMGWFRLSHDSESKHISVFRLMIAMLSFAFMIYMIPGLWGAPVKLLSGIIPPSTYSESPHGFSGGGGGQDESKLPEHAHFGPHNIPEFDNYDYALAYAKQTNKPLMLDFTGWACANCRRMEDNVWSDPEVKRRLVNDVVLVSLYVDDKRELPKEEQVEVEWNGKRKLITIGNKWSFLQQQKFKALAQPQYWIVDHNGEPLIGSSDYAKGHEPPVYAKWIDSGVEAFKNKK